MNDEPQASSSEVPAETPACADASDARNTPDINGELAATPEPVASSPTLAVALERWQVQVPEEAVPKLEQYCQLLWQQNEILNLTRHTNFDLFVTRDLVDTIELAKHLNPDEDVLDIGSGGGVPGIPLAILRPDLRVSLAESVGKKAKALEEVIAELQIPVTVFAERAEKLLEDLRFDVGVARAVGSLAKLTQWFRGNWISLGRLLAIKGPKWVEEHAESEAAGLMKRLQVKVACQYPVPGQAWESVILKVWPKGNREK
jgi:16S rRNA (guanine527-N7)-methyltransferase